jgi:hypothetical protein
MPWPAVSPSPCLPARMPITVENTTENDATQQTNKRQTLYQVKEYFAVTIQHQHVRDSQTTLLCPYLNNRMSLKQNTYWWQKYFRNSIEYYIWCLDRCDFT